MFFLSGNTAVSLAFHEINELNICIFHTNVGCFPGGVIALRGPPPPPPPPPRCFLSDGLNCFIFSTYISLLHACCCTIGRARGFSTERSRCVHDSFPSTNKQPSQHGRSNCLLWKRRRGLSSFCCH